MTAEAIAYAALKGLASGSVFPDVAPAKTAPPWITYQAVGGQDFTDLSGSPPETLNQRMQVTAWSKTRAQASALIQQARIALVSPGVLAVPIGAPDSVFEDATMLYGSRLDFSINYKA